MERAGSRGCFVHEVFVECEGLVTGEVGNSNGAPFLINAWPGRRTCEGRFPVATACGTERMGLVKALVLSAPILVARYWCCSFFPPH